MYHVPIVETDIKIEQIEFCHINKIAQKGEWIKDYLICLDHIKLNVFMQGDFFVVVNNKVYNPVYGDICILPPFTTHYGQILKTTHTDYFQLDIGMDAFDGVPEGRKLLEKIISNKDTPFFRPTKKQSDEMVEICKAIEKAISEGKMSLAFARTIELLNTMIEAFKTDAQVDLKALSKHISFTTNYIDANFSSDIKISHIAELCGVSTSYLSREFKKEVGVSVHTYLNNCRLLKSTYLLKNMSVADTAYECGFCDSSHYICSFKRMFGCTPAQYLKANK